MRGAIGFLVGTIGFCVFAAITPIVGMNVRGREAAMIVAILIFAALVFLNVLVVGFYRMMGHLHEASIFPDDPHYHPLRGRVPFFLGYFGLLLVLASAFLLFVMTELFRFRIGPRDEGPLFGLAWAIGWASIGCMLGGVLMLLSNIFHKAFFRNMVGPPDDDLDISRRGSRRPTRLGDGEEDRVRRWGDE